MDIGSALHGKLVLFKWNAGDRDDSWCRGLVFKRPPSKADINICPTANALVKFDFGAVACELSRETYGADLKWVLLRKLG